MKTSTSAMNQPWRAEPRERPVAVDRADASPCTIVGKRTRKPQKISACIDARDEPLEQLALPEHDRRLVPHAAREVVGALERPRGADEPDEEAARAARTAAPATASSAARATAPATRRYEPRTFLSSAVIAGTISCRSPITA